MRIRCEQCVNKIFFAGSLYRCIPFGHAFGKGARGCLYGETDITKRVTDPITPSVRNTHNYPTPFAGSFNIHTMCINGHWYYGVDFERTSDRGAHYKPSVYGKAFDTELDAINGAIDSMMIYCKDLPNVVQFLKQCKSDNAQLSLF